jgi:epoxide hydrolase-like predicted phosphatase
VNKMRKFKAVIFDLGSVLASNEWPLVYRKIANELKIEEEKVRSIVKPLFRRWSIGEIDEEGFWKEFEKQAGIILPSNFKRDFWLKTYIEWSEDIEGSWEILVKLKKKGIRLALLSNIIEPHVLANERMGRLTRLKKLGFEAFVWSYEERLRKPDPKIYEVMLQRLNLPAKSCVFVDDEISNVEAAKAMGMEGIHFQNPKQLKQELIRLSLL